MHRDGHSILVEGSSSGTIDDGILEVRPSNEDSGLLEVGFSNEDSKTVVRKNSFEARIDIEEDLAFLALSKIMVV